MQTRLHSLVVLILLGLSAPAVMAQIVAQTATTAEAEVTITVQRQQVRFAAAGTLREWRLEIHDQAGQLIHDSGLVTGSEIAWPLLNAEAQAVASGLYAYTLTFKELHAPAPQVRRGHVIIDRVAERKGDRLWVTARSESGVEITASESEDVAIAGVRTDEKRRHNKSDDNERAAETDDKEASAADPNAQAVTGTGTPNQLVRIGEPSLRAISVRKRGKPRGADGSGVEASGEMPSTGERTPIISNRLAPDSATASSQSVTGSGTASQAAKWTAASMIEDSIITDTGTNVGIGTTTPGSKLTVAGAIDTTTEYNIGGVRVLSIAGAENLFAGVGAGLANTTGRENAFFGRYAGAANTTSSLNAFFGANAGRENTTGNNNAFFGGVAGLSNTTGKGNSFFGYGAGYYNTTASGNSFFGSSAGSANTTGFDNSFFGNGAGGKNTTGHSNAFFGIAAGEANTNGEQNAFFGRYAGASNTTASFNAFFGANAGAENTTGRNNAFFGGVAGQKNTTGSSNSFFGYGAGNLNTTGSGNSFFGSSAGSATTTGGDNAFFGINAGLTNTTGNSNAFFGRDAGKNNTTGHNNAFFGIGAGLGNTAGVENAFFGRYAGEVNTASSNVFLGANAGRANTSGANNVFVGTSAGFINVTGSDNTFIGHKAGPGGDRSNLTNATVIGANASAECDNCMVLGNNVNVGIGTSRPQARLDIEGQTRTNVLQIDGGSDFAENFDVSLPAAVAAATPLSIAPGLVVSIDAHQPGKLIVSSQAYDRRVAGIISGAGGVKSGMIMGQSGSVADGAHPVALSGRVYVWADASAGAIQAGNLLTTSPTPGHAMKVKQHVRAQGAIIGKAMTSLKQGKGLVLVLVTLQ